MRTSGLLLILALLVATGSIALAAIPGGDGTITACAHKRSGALRLIDTAKTKRCKSSERRVAWNQRGPAGANGAAGATGARGPAGASGTSGAAGANGSGGGTADVYTKSESDGRYLGKVETAQNALRLGDEPSDNFLRGVGESRGTTTSVLAGTSGTLGAVSDGSLVGNAEVTCADPATDGTIRFRGGPTRSVNVITDDGGATPAATTVSGGAATGTTTLSTGDHVTYTVQSSSTIARIDVWAILAPSGANLCRFLTFVDVRFG
jgi:hypothetical protein